LKLIKKIVAILVLVVFLFNTMGYYFVFEVNKSILRNDMRSLINSGAAQVMMHLIRIENQGSNRNFKKLDRTEFLYYGQLYDIVSESVKGNVTIYYCINDTHEERLLGNFEKMQNLTAPAGSSDRSKQLLSLLQNLITIALVQNPSYLKRPCPVNVKFPLYRIFLTSNSIIPIPRPPEFV
jgi:hypothetical protein